MLLSAGLPTAPASFGIPTLLAIQVIVAVQTQRCSVWSAPSPVPSYCSPMPPSPSL
ncbi:hypothetical protein PF005_g8950 [Phytophthora fragariae]|uniref:Uncharacterized protein n=1 Tax=Phytophthora fragariae TaxID=53985 RepID=A0A6A4DJG6_9STRA|nr:hypothetical protein PF003_g28025 [Phytophthora fragariae]KAE8940261.1 hypothetical protein PF009_g9926 [Phytophthora fragariae]KAE9014792.1 hypothetical protein PF011_g7914 [Phytophthora fragariae]KAE9118138.1 hypothetical protein PF007_g9038 [Phytophthora fragariae]KAE9118209.1 hypothetical protein PF010_g8305 [Phytophthora fragariae]